MLSRFHPQRPSWQSASVAVAFALATTVLAACGSSSTTSAPSATTAASTAASGGSPSTPAATAVVAGESNVTLHIGDQEQKTQTLLEAAGQLSNLPYKVSWADFTSGPPELQALEAGSLALASSVGDTPPLFANAAGGGGAQLRIVAAFKESPGDTNAILVPKGSSITSVAQLKGKKVAVAQASSGHLTLLLALQKAGLAWKDITPVYLQPAQAEAAFAQGSVAAWSVWYPFVSVATGQGGKIIETGTDLDPGYGYLLSSASNLGNSSTSAAIGDFVKRLDLAEQWATQHPTAWAAKFETISGLSASQSLITVQKSLEQGVPINATLLAAEQEEANAFTAAGFIKQIQVSTFTLPTFNSDVPAS